MAQRCHCEFCSWLDQYRIQRVTIRLHGEARLDSKIFRELYILLCTATDVEREQIAELQNVGESFQFFSTVFLFCGELCPSVGFILYETRFNLTLSFRDPGSGLLRDANEMPAHNVSASVADGFGDVDGLLPGIHELAHAAGNERFWAALCDRPALHDGLRVGYAPAGIMQRNRSYDLSVQCRQVDSGQLCGKLPGQRGVRRLGDHPATVLDLPLRTLHHAPCRQKFSAGGGHGIESEQNHQRERRLAMR